MIRRTVTVIIIAAVALTANVALAKDQGTGAAPVWAGSVYAFSHEAPTTNFASQAVIGLGYEMVGAMSKGSHWGWAIGGGYGIGGLKDESTSGSFSTTAQSTLTFYELRLGFDYYDDCCDEDWYCGPGFFYSSTNQTFKQTGNPDVKFDPVREYGFDPRIGGSMKLSDSLRLFGSTSMRIGYSSWDDKLTPGSESKLTGWRFDPTWRGGLSIKY
ncbi:MAG: hypothetical protein HYR74_13070 [Candidatus Eisenbacteria bacterium]|nr:hypothetical protein [Candidatus Eisenbacteria bacterium]